MRKSLGLLVILVLAIGAWGYHRGWFSVESGGSDGTPNVTFGLDKEKLKHDTDITAASYAATLKSHQGKLGKLEELGKNATGDAKSDIEEQVKELGGRHGALSKKLAELKTASGPKYDELKSELKTALGDLDGDLDQALAAAGKK